MTPRPCAKVRLKTLSQLKVKVSWEGGEVGLVVGGEREKLVRDTLYSFWKDSSLSRESGRTETQQMSRLNVRAGADSSPDAHKP